MKAEILNKYIDASVEAKQAFNDVSSSIFIEIRETLNVLRDKNLKPTDAKEILEYGILVGQYLALIEISTGSDLDKSDKENLIEDTPNKLN